MLLIKLLFFNVIFVCLMFSASADNSDACYTIIFQFMIKLQAKDPVQFASMIDTKEFASSMVDLRTNLGKEFNNNNCNSSTDFILFTLEAFRAFESYDSMSSTQKQCAHFLALIFRSNLQPCTSVSLYVLCLKSEKLVEKLHLNNDLLANLPTKGCKNMLLNEFTQTVPIEQINFEAYGKLYSNYSNYPIADTGLCYHSAYDTLIESTDVCQKEDFKFVGKCLRERYLGYRDGEDHCAIEENSIRRCVKSCSQYVAYSCSPQILRFLPWVLRLSRLTNQFLKNTLCLKDLYGANYNTVNLTPNDEVDDTLVDSDVNQSDNICSTFDDGLKVANICMKMRAYMYRFQLNPCLEWLVFYSCIRDIKAAYCGYTSDTCLYHKFLKGSMSTSLNSNNEWTLQYCSEIDVIYKNEFFVYLPNISKSGGKIAVTAGFEWCK